MLKDFTLSLELEPTENRVIQTGATYWSHDVNTAKIYIELLRKGTPIILNKDVTVRVMMLFDDDNKSEHIYTAKIEDELKGLVSITLEESMRAYVGQVTCGVYVDYQNEEKTDNGYFTFGMRRSLIDKDMPELQKLYVSDFEKALEKFKEIENKIEQNDVVTYPELKEYTYTKKHIDENIQDLSNLKANKDEVLSKKEAKEALSYKADKQKTETALNELERKKADQSFVDAQLSSIVSGAPKGTYKTLQALKEAYPDGTEGVFLVLENGHWYYYANGWQDGGVYQAEDIKESSVTAKHLYDSRPLGVNLLDVYSAEKGYYIDGKTGELTAGESSTGLNVASDYIEVDGGFDYHVLMFSNIVEYDSSKKFINNTIGGKRVITLADNTNYVRLSFKFEDIDKAFFSQGRTFKNYMPYIFYQKNNHDKQFDINDKIKWEHGMVYPNGTTGGEKNFVNTAALMLNAGDIIQTKKEFHGKVKFGLQKYDDKTNETISVISITKSTQKYVVKDTSTYRITASYTNEKEIEQPDDFSRFIEIIQNGLNNHIIVPELNEKAPIKSLYSYFSSGLTTDMFEHGTYRVSAPEGLEYRTDRISSGLFFLKQGTIIKNISGGGLKFQLMEYDQVGNFLKMHVALNSITEQHEIENGGLYRLILAYKNDGTIESFSELVDSIKIVDVTENKTKQKTKSPGRYVKHVKLPSFSGAQNFSSHCFVKDEFWAFTASDYDESKYDGIVYRYKVTDDIDFEFLGSFKHNWGHVNAVGYANISDTIIFSSFHGSATPSDQIKYEIYLLENISSFKNEESVSLRENAIVIDVPKEWGWRMNATFGEDNLGAQNIVYYITNDNKDIRKLLLGKNDLDLGNGNFMPSKKGYNGSYKVLKHYKDSDSLEVNNGAFWDGEKLLIGLGHEGVFYQETFLNDDGTISKIAVTDNFFDEKGNQLWETTGFSDVTKHNGFYYLGLQGGWIFIYKEV